MLLFLLAAGWDNAFAQLVDCHWTPTEACHYSDAVPVITDWTIVGEPGAIVIDAKLKGGGVWYYNVGPDDDGAEPVWRMRFGVDDPPPGAALRSGEVTRWPCPRDRRAVAAVKTAMRKGRRVAARPLTPPLARSRVPTAAQVQTGSTQAPRDHRDGFRS